MATCRLIRLLALSLAELVYALVLVTKVAMQFNDLLWRAADARDVGLKVSPEFGGVLHVGAELIELLTRECRLWLLDLATVARNARHGQRIPLCLITQSDSHCWDGDGVAGGSVVARLLIALALKHLVGCVGGGLVFALVMGGGLLCVGWVRDYVVAKLKLKTCWCW